LRLANSDPSPPKLARVVSIPLLPAPSTRHISSEAHFLTCVLSRMKKTVIVDVVVVNSVMWAEGWERGERGKS
jgi:hypothetical protein